MKLFKRLVPDLKEIKFWASVLYLIVIHNVVYDWMKITLGIKGYEMSFIEQLHLALFTLLALVLVVIIWGIICLLIWMIIIRPITIGIEFIFDKVKEETE